jgi:enoyl-CoA hydratase/carnithine racemase
MATISDLNKAFKLLSKNTDIRYYFNRKWRKAFAAGADISEFANFHRTRIPTCSRRSRKII